MLLFVGVFCNCMYVRTSDLYYCGISWDGCELFQTLL